MKLHPVLNYNQGLGHLSSELLKCQRAGLRFDFLDHNMCKTRLLGEAAHKPALRTHFRTEVASRQKNGESFSRRGTFHRELAVRVDMQLPLIGRETFRAREAPPHCATSSCITASLHSLSQNCSSYLSTLAFKHRW